MNKFALSVILAILIVGITPFYAASEPLTATPSGIPFSELDQFIDTFVGEYIGTRTAGAVVAIIQDGELIFNQAYGYAIQGEIRADADSIFEWGSATKLLLWTSVMQLVEQGKLDLNNDIREYLPENFLRRQRYEMPITMLDLMNHTPGWEDRLVDIFYSRAEDVPSLEGSLRTWKPRQFFQPGTVVAYSNYGTGLAGFIVERVSGMPFYQYVWENIFIPLGMRETAIHPLQADNPDIAERRTQIKGHFAGREHPVVSPVERIFLGLYPAGSVMGTAQDAIKFLSALMPAEGETSPLFMDNETLNEMLSVTLYFREGFPRFSHGFMEHYGAVRALGHGGNTSAFSALFTFAPEERFGVVIMTNQAQEAAICFGLTRALFGEFVPPQYAGDFPDASSFGGMFTMARRPKTGFMNLPMSLAMFPITVVDENTLDMAGARLVQVSPYVFKNTGGGIAIMDLIDYIFIEANDGNVTRVSIMFFDLLPINTGRLIVNFGSAILFVLCILFVAVALVLIIIGAVRNKKKGIACNLMKKLNLALFISMAAVTLNNVIFAMRGLSFASYASLQIHFVLNIVFVIAVPVLVGLMFVSRKKEPAKASRVFQCFTMVIALVYAILLLAWGFWH
ncbi:MAG: beta-lactamase family protein [Treponema sp.]|nr:beta-lactamase family protein [Treponema sp.]